VTGVSWDDMLEMYGLFKQAKVGDNTTAKPGILDPKGRKKWEAWTSKKGAHARARGGVGGGKHQDFCLIALQCSRIPPAHTRSHPFPPPLTHTLTTKHAGMSKEEAMKAYIDYVAVCLEKYRKPEAAPA
jgi:acyl-CoA-binding protein